MNKVLFSSKKEDWTTPKELFFKLDYIYNFTLDPCSDEFNHLCDKYYTIKENGLLQSWKNEVVFCNPPYGRKIYDWVKKCYLENINNNVEIILLIPSRTDTKFFHDFLYHNKRVDIYFIKGRLKFGNADNTAPFPSLIAHFRSKKSS